ncbi:hypothetical protein [Rhodoferax saidenbachensis]|uniref:Uncharacterized protein n=1 Tax=Rhodoferax saidenbachensis TaxID=1484693 RepID=A0A1P8KAY8_9BURK|nr:hypothetical protein [Rhodoferax saidenbachensis]APW43174.1 hypothetical protein RS694_11990 [Rhodoferax saidenbachensis]
MTSHASSPQPPEIAAWAQTRDRLRAHGLFNGPGSAVSLRVPATHALWFGRADDAAPLCIAIDGGVFQDEELRLHQAIYQHRTDVCAIASGVGRYGQHLTEWGGRMPGIFDEQVRHLGAMPFPAVNDALLQAALSHGTNALCLYGQPVVLGMTAERLVLNAELFEKCAKAFGLATATGRSVKALPWLVRWVANRRLFKDQQKAIGRVRQGLLPQESAGY